jgi:hypothetical protein
MLAVAVFPSLNSPGSSAAALADAVLHSTPNTAGSRISAFLDGAAAAWQASSRRRGFATAAGCDDR